MSQNIAAKCFKNRSIVSGGDVLSLSSYFPAFLHS